MVCRGTATGMEVSEVPLPEVPEEIKKILEEDK